MWMEVAVAAIIAVVTATAVATAVLFCIYRLITLLGDPVNAKMEAVIDEDKAEQLKDMSAKLDKRWAKLEEREKAERPWGQDDPLINALGRLRYFFVSPGRKAGSSVTGWPGRPLSTASSSAIIASGPRRTMRDITIQPAGKMMA